MSEKELILEIDRLTGESKTLGESIKQVQSLLAREIGDALLLVHPLKSGTSFAAEKTVVDFLESRAFPFRGVYTAPIAGSQWPEAILVACFGSWDAPSSLFRRATAHTAKQLESLLIRAHGGVLPQREAA